MSGRGERPRPRVVLVFGEDDKDTRSLAMLIRALRPELESAVQARRTPSVYMKDASAAKAKRSAAKIAAAVAAERKRHEVVCVFVHQDKDALEPAHLTVARRIEEELVAAGCPVHAVTPAWELEAWWFLWPDAVHAVNPGWREPADYVSKNVGSIKNAKESLRRCLRPPPAKGKKKPTRDCQESDSFAIAQRVRDLGLVSNPLARSASYDAFRSRIARCADAFERQA